MPYIFKMDHNWIHTVICIVTLMPIVYTQAPECPNPWVAEGGKCYLFSQDVLPWLDAKIACEKYGAELVSVNSQVENNFLQNWFSQFDNIPNKRNRWYTSAEGTGPQRNPTWTWMDGTSFGSIVFWVDDPEPRDGDGFRVLYQYADTGRRLDQPGYYWYRDQGSIPYRYICEILKTESSRIISKGRDFYFGVDDYHPDRIYRGPYFVSQPEDIMYQVSSDAGKVQEECTTDCSSVSFNCEARGLPQPKYRWFEQKLQTTRELSSTTNSDKLTITNGRLTVHDPKKGQDTGIYWCEASNEFGTIRSSKARIKYIVLEEFPKNSKRIAANQYESAVIPCDHPRQEGVTYQYTWFLGGVRDEFVTPIYNNHIFISKSGDLYFSAVFSSDINTYTCQVSTDEGYEARASPPYSLDVDTSQSYKPIGPLIRDDFPQVVPQNPKKGDRVILECLARFARREGEAAIYTWKRENGRPLPADHELTDYNRQLVIKNVQPEDEGVYTCHVSYQSASNQKDITLSISAKPYFTEGGLDDQHQDEGSRFTWLCLANGDPTPSYYWLRNAKPFNADTLLPGMKGRIEFGANNRSIVFKKLDKDVDPGMYQCVAHNTHGTAYSNAQLRVLEFGPSFTKRPMLGRILATEGGNATIACDPEAAPKARIKWLKDGKEFDVKRDSSSSKRLLPNDYLFLSNIARSIDEGTYTCVAENDVANPETGEPTSTAQASVELVVVQRSRLAFGPVDNKEVLLGDRQVLRCRADFNPILDLVYLWFHNDRLIDFDDWKMSQLFSRGVNTSRGDLIIPKITYEEAGRYRCQVQTKSDSAVLSAVIKVIGPPGEPAGVKPSNPLKHSVNLRWTKGADNGAPISKYVIERYNVYSKKWVNKQNVTSPSEVANANTTVTGLFANTGYKFRVRAVNIYGVGVPSMESDVITTSEDKPTSYPENIRAGEGEEGGKEGTLVILWDPLPREEWNSDSIQYIAEYREYNGDIESGSWTRCNGGPIQHGSAKSGKCVVTLGLTKFYTKYYIRVWAQNTVGRGPVPRPVTGMSSVKVPTETPQKTVCQPFNSTSLIAYWEPIPNKRQITGGELLGFHIQYWKDGTRPAFARRVTIFGNVTEGQIIGLEPNTDYWVRVQMFNSAGDGTPGRPVVQTTWMNAPQNMPEYVTINKTEDRTLGVHFRGVVTQPDEEPLDGYKVRIWRQGESLRSVKDYDCGRRTWIYIDDNFEQRALYNLRVFGYSRGGIGKMSSPLIQFSFDCSRIRPKVDEETRLVLLCNSSQQITTSLALILSIFLFYLLK